MFATDHPSFTQYHKRASLTSEVLWVAFPQALVLAVYLPSRYLRQKTQISKPFWPSGKGRISSGRSHRISLILCFFNHDHTQYVNMFTYKSNLGIEDIKSKRTHKTSSFSFSKNGS